MRQGGGRSGSNEVRLPNRAPAFERVSCLVAGKYLLIQALEVLGKGGYN